jgi:hypothetical protein
MPGALPEHCREHMHVRNGTDGLTKKLLTFSSSLTFVNVREMSANA